MLYGYTEIGIGNPTFINTEIEYPDGTETRQPGFVKFEKTKSLYMRLWVGKKVYSLSSNEGFTTRQKNRKAFKLLLGVWGIVLPKEIKNSRVSE